MNKMAKLVEKIMDYESGMMEEEDTVSFFQELVDTGYIRQLQGHYQRTTQALIREGLVVVPGKLIWRFKIQNPSTGAWHDIPLRFSYLEHIDTYRQALCVPYAIISSPLPKQGV